MNGAVGTSNLEPNLNTSPELRTRNREPHYLRRLRRRTAIEVRISGLAAWRGFVEMLNSDDLTYAASIAYWALLSLFPFLLLIISIFGTITAGDEQRFAVLSFLFRYFPTRFDFLADQLDALRQARIRLGLAGGLSLVWASLGVFGAVTSAVNNAWGVEKQRSFLKHRLVSFLMLVAAGGVMMMSLVVVSIAQVAEASRFGTFLERFGWVVALESWIAASLATILLIVGVGFVYYFIPNAKTRLRDVWVGAILTGLLWRGTFELFSWYLGNGERYTMYGSIATVVVFLFWVYVSSVILMYGVEFTAAYARIRRHRAQEMPAAATPRT